MAGAARPGRARLARSRRWVRPGLDVVGSGVSGHPAALPRLDARSVLADDQHAGDGGRDGRHLRPALQPGAQYLFAVPDPRPDRLAAVEGMITEGCDTFLREASTIMQV